jgi:hypothetical protein
MGIGFNLKLEKFSSYFWLYAICARSDNRFLKMLISFGLKTTDLNNGLIEKTRGIQ